MAFFTWQEKFAFGIKSIDDDHKKLVSLIDELYTLMSQGKAKEVVGEIVKELVEYTKVHFGREEMYMRTIGYAELDEHTEAHRAFIEKIDLFQNKLAAGKDNISVELVMFLRNWLSGHILNTDKKFVPEMQKNGVK